MSFTFGTPGGAVAGGLSFATPAATTTTSTQDSGAAKLVRFNTPASSATASPFSGFGVAPSSTAAAPNSLAGLLSAPLTTASTTGLTLGTSTTAPKPFSFATAAPTAVAPTLGLSTTVPALGGAVAPSTGFGLAVPAAASSISSGLGGLSSLSASKAPSLGLGGIGPTTSTSSSNSKAGDAKALKEMELPPPILEVVNQFVKNIKEQKKVREEIARMSSKPLYQVEEDVKNLRQQLMTISSILQRYTSAIDRLKQDSVIELRHADIAQRTRDTPLGLQFENTAPIDYFERLVEDFHIRMSIYRQQIAETEGHFSSVSAGVNGGSSPQDLEVLLTRLNEGFLSVTAHLQGIHEAVRAQKEAYLRYRKTVHGDFSAEDAFTRQGSKPGGNGQATTKPTLPPNMMGVSPFTSRSVSLTATTNIPAAAAPGVGGQGNTGMFGGGGPGGGMFGSSGGMFGSGNTAPGGTGLFGSGAAPSSVSGSGGMFGGATSNLGGGLFGGNSTTSGGMFGAPPSTAGGGMFGTPSTAGGGLFGASTPANTGGSMFGGASTASTGFNIQSPGGGLFASTAQKPVFGVSRPLG